MARKKSEARQSRAQQLRAEIKRLTKKSSAAPAKQESPAAFVHRRMAEFGCGEEARHQIAVSGELRDHALVSRAVTKDS